MRDVFIIGVDTIKFGKHMDKSIKDLAITTATGCLKDAGLNKNDIQALWFSNSAWGEYKRQVCIRGQVALRPLGIDAIPITNLENACAGGSTAFHHAWMGIASGMYDVTMALGAEKIHDRNQSLVFSGFLTGLDVGNFGKMLETLGDVALSDDEKWVMAAHIEKYRGLAEKGSGKKKKKTFKDKFMTRRDALVVAIRIGETMGYDMLKKLRKLGSGDHSPFMDVYGYEARQHMKRFGSTIEQLAVIASKNHFHSSLNPNAQYQFLVSPEQVLADRLVTWPLTRSMCAPIGDGAASAIVHCLDQPFTVYGFEFHVTASVGYAVAGGTGLTPSEIVRRADLAEANKLLQTGKSDEAKEVLD